jgi:hypothetical protein
MCKFKMMLISGLLFANLGIQADSTIVGFEDTLNNEDKTRLQNFMAAHKKNGYTKCYYQTSEDTVVCENSAQDKMYFK